MQKNDVCVITVYSKQSDNINCPHCREGIIIPFNPEFEINHAFICNNCGWSIHLEANVTVE